MSYEHCDRHDEDATNGCGSCIREDYARALAAQPVPDFELLYDVEGCLDFHLVRVLHDVYERGRQDGAESEKRLRTAMEQARTMLAQASSMSTVRSAQQVLADALAKTGQMKGWE